MHGKSPLTADREFATFPRASKSDTHASLCGVGGGTGERDHMNTNESDGRRAMFADALRLAPLDLENLTEPEETALVEPAIALQRPPPI